MHTFAVKTQHFVNNTRRKKQTQKKKHEQLDHTRFIEKQQKKSLRYNI